MKAFILIALVGLLASQGSAQSFEDEYEPQPFDIVNVAADGPEELIRAKKAAEVSLLKIVFY